MSDRGPSATTLAPGLSVSPAPTDEEVAAIMAATVVLWPTPSALGPEIVPRNTAWRFSSRSWARPIPIRRLRPWR